MAIIKPLMPIIKLSRGHLHLDNYINSAHIHDDLEENKQSALKFVRNNVKWGWELKKQMQTKLLLLKKNPDEQVKKIISVKNFKLKNEACPR